MNSNKNDVDKEVNDKDKKKIFITTKIKKHKNWTKDEDILLLEIADKFKQKSWTKVSTFFVDKNPAQCRARYKRIRPGIIKGAWAKEEDQAILDFVAANGKNWALISKMMPTRNGKQIRDRFLNYLDPNINRDKFTEDEDKKIIEHYIEHGSKWSVIAKNFDGRTGDMIKNRFYSCLKRKIHIYEITLPKRIRKKYYKSKKLRNLKENNYNNTSKNIRCRFSIMNAFPKNGIERNCNYEQSGKNENVCETKIITEHRSPSSTFNYKNNNINNPNENFRSQNKLNDYNGNLYPEFPNSMNTNPHGVNLNLEQNILNFAATLSNLLNEDQITKIKGAFINDKEKNYYSEVLSKNIENLSTFNYIALSKILQLKQQIFQDEKSANSIDTNNRQIIEYLQSMNAGNTDCIPFILNYLKSRSKSV